MHEVFRTNSFKKDYKKLPSVNKQILKEIVSQLANNKTLDKKYKDHKLVGNYNDCRECHLKPDLLLIYRINNNILELALTRVGSHSELFRN